MSLSRSQSDFRLKTLFIGSLGTIPESHARTVDQKQLAAWIKEGLLEHRRAEKLYALTAKGESRLR
jgi:hypothetical protein